MKDRMQKINPTEKWTIGDLIAIVGRIAISILFFVSAYVKIVYPDMIVSKIESSGLPFPRIGLLLSIFLEVAIPLLLILGIRLRIMATTLLSYSIITAVIFHRNFSDQAQLIQFLKNIAIAGGLLQIISLGGGKLCLDYIMAGRR